MVGTSPGIGHFASAPGSGPMNRTPAGISAPRGCTASLMTRSSHDLGQDRSDEGFEPLRIVSLFESGERHVGEVGQLPVGIRLVRGISDRLAIGVEEALGRFAGYFAREVRAHP